MIKTIEWTDGTVRLIDQTRLPLEEVFVDCADYQCIAEAIKTMKIRGAPAIGVAAAFGLALAAYSSGAGSSSEVLEDVKKARSVLAETRPTAANLFWALDRVVKRADENVGADVDKLRNIVIEEAIRIAEEDRETNERMGAIGQELISDGDNILTHCNTGALAASEYGTALGVVRAAWDRGTKIRVYACETRPLLQGARLTAWELKKLGIPAVLIVDGAAGYFMSQGKIDKVFVGADCVTSNGDTANKIGTYSLAVLARENNIPFYVVSPVSTIDINLKSGQEIIIEDRPDEEVTRIMDCRIAPEGFEVANPSFDVTPAGLITAIVTEKGIAYPPYTSSLKALMEKA
ncbi:MAG: S-methyl-5-thioribose-1-phosphate isomerase [Actinomycetota bacterium]